MIKRPVTIDLRSDAVTRPTEGMWAAMRADHLDWSKQEDRSVMLTEGLAADITGKEAAILVPSGTMANTLALLCWTRAGDEFITDEGAHVVVSEDHAFARLAGIYPRRLAGLNGHLQADQVQTAVDDQRLGHKARTSLVWLENTHNASGGTVTDPKTIYAVSSVAHSSGAMVHLDGARLFNACTSLQASPRDLLDPVDSVTVNLNKALSAPAGALLCGPAPFIREARARAVGLGGILSQAGLMAAAGRIALETMTDRIAEDHLTATHLAEGVRGLGPFIVPQSIDTNIVMVGVGGGLSSSFVLRILARSGVGALAYDEHTIRLVTHRHIQEQHVVSVIDAFSMSADALVPQTAKTQESLPIESTSEER